MIDKVNGLSIPRYLVYDVVKYEGRDVGQEAFYPNRLDCIVKKITGNYNVPYIANVFRLSKP